MFTRRRALGFLGSALFLPGCSAAPAPGTVRVGSTASAENQTIAEIYALALERAKIRVDRRMRLGASNDVLSAVRRGDIDVFPGEIYDTTLDGAHKALYEARYRITWLDPSPANVGSCIATSQYVAEQYSLLTLAKCAQLAPRLRLAASRDFAGSGGELEPLQRAYGGFRFKTISLYEPGTQYYALNRGDADVANGVATDPNVGEDQLVILADEKRVLLQYRYAPVARIQALRSHASMAAALNGATRRLSAYALQAMNMRRDMLRLDPVDVAEEFLSRQ